MNPRRPRRIALTGGIATGKSHVRARFAELGVPTIDSDTLAREAVAPGTPGLAAVVARFGQGILDESGGLNRRDLSTIVFADAAARRDLEAIIHPWVLDATERWFASLPDTVALAIADVPLLYEVGRDRDFETVIVAACAPDVQRARLMKRDGITETEAAQRLAAQLPIAEKVARADHVIVTDGTFSETVQQIDRLYRTLTATAA